MKTDTYVHSYRKVIQHIVYDGRIVENLVYESETYNSDETPSIILKLTNSNSLFLGSLEWWNFKCSKRKNNSNWTFKIKPPNKLGGFIFTFYFYDCLLVLYCDYFLVFPFQLLLFLQILVYSLMLIRGYYTPLQWQ